MVSSCQTCLDSRKSMMSLTLKGLETKGDFACRCQRFEALLMCRAVHRWQDRLLFQRQKHFPTAAHAIFGNAVIGANALRGLLYKVITNAAASAILPP